MQFSIMCFLIAKYLYIISYSYSTSAVLMCLILTHHQPERHSQEFLPLKGYAEGCQK